MTLQELWWETFARRRQRKTAVTKLLSGGPNLQTVH